MDKKYNLEEMKKKALQQFKTGMPLFGKGGAFAPLLQDFLQEALEAEMEAHLTQEERSKGNKRNGRGSKKVKTSVGTFEIHPPEDRHSSFKPYILPKRETVLADTLQDKIIGLYGRGMSSRDISKHLEEIYDTKISHNTLMAITDRIIPAVKKWQARPLKSFYPIMYLDAMYQKIQANGTATTKAVYNILAINKDGYNEILGVYIKESEGANFWLEVLTNLQNRGLKDVLIVCTDNLTGFGKAIQAVFPKAQLQTCVVHQIRNSLKYIGSKDKKDFMTDLKKVYKAPTKEMAKQELTVLEQKWGEKYPIVIRSWYDNWSKLSTYFEYTEPIRRLIYTTNMIEGYHRQLRKVTKNKGVFPNDDALLKLIYLATKNIEKKWTVSARDWCLAVQQLSIKFGDRMILDLDLK